MDETTTVKSETVEQINNFVNMLIELINRIADFFQKLFGGEAEA